MTGSRSFESGEVVEIVGVRAFYLNKFIERNLYGIRPSRRAGVVRKRRRQFTEDDVFGIALVWWLFESGFRAEVIARVLREISHSRKAEASTAARLLRQQMAHSLVVVREPRRDGTSSNKPVQNVELLDEAGTLRRVKENAFETLCIVPIGPLLLNLSAKMNNIQNGGE
jgi:DNA-binding transcriptional MerR regulator